MQFQEVVEAEGHLIDSHVMERSSTRSSNTTAGSKWSSSASAAPTAIRPTCASRWKRRPRTRMERLLNELLGLGCSPVDPSDAQSARRWSATAARRRISTPPPTTAPSCATAASGCEVENQRMDALVVVATGARTAAACATSGPATTSWSACAASAWCRNRRSATAWRSPSCPTASPRSGRWRPPCARPPR